MANISDGALVDAILSANIDSFDFDNCAFEELLDEFAESDLCDSVSGVQPPPGSYPAIVSDCPTVVRSSPYIHHGTPAANNLALASAVSSSCTSIAMDPHFYANSLQQIHSDGNPGSMTSQPRRTSLGNGSIQHHPNSTSVPIGLHRNSNVGASNVMGVELQTFVDGHPDKILNMHQAGANRYRLEPSGSFRNKIEQAPVLAQQQQQLPLHYHHQQQQQQHHHQHHPARQSVSQLPTTTFQPNDASSVQRRLHGRAPNRPADTGDLDVNGFHSSGLIAEVGAPMEVGDHQSSEEVLEKLFSDREEMNRLLSQIIASDNQLNQVLVGSDVSTFPPASSAIVMMPNADQVCSSYPDTPPESGSEAHSPPDNIPPTASENSSHDVRSNSFSQGSAAAAARNRPSLPPYYAPHLTASASGNHPPQQPQHPGLAKASPAAQFDQPTIATLDPQLLLTEYNRGSLSHKSKKRKHSISPQNSINSSLLGTLAIASLSSNLPVKPVGLPANLPVKPEPAVVSDGSEDDTYGYDNGADNNAGSYQVIKWSNHLTNEWAALVDESGHDCSVASYRVDADKGFNFSGHDEAFVCQKKNHFQVTVHITFPGSPKFLRSTADERQKIDDFFLTFHGIKMESPSQHIKIEQSQSDRSKRPLHPVRVDFGSPPQLTAKAVIGRLHFSETTTNNMRKRGKPNPDQRYFQLVVSLVARCGSKDFLVAAQVSERIIVRASNPGQFDGDADGPWSKGKVPDSVVHMGNVGINIENPDEALTVHGNIKLTGHVVAPSDVRAKTDLKELDTSQQLKNISQINVYHYRYNDKFAKYAGLDSSAQTDTGVLAQEVSLVLPDAVQEVGDVVLPDGERIESFLVVNKDRIFIEGIGAVKELCKVTDKLEDRINEIEIMNKRLKKHGHNRDSVKSTQSARSDLSTCSSISRNDNLRSSTSAGKVNPGGLSMTQSSGYHSRHHHCHHHRHHHRNDDQRNSDEISKKEEKGVCSNRIVQVVIIILVLIMALCLTAITTWFIVKDSLSLDSNSGNPTPPGGGSNGSLANTTEPYDIDSTEEPPTFNEDLLIWPDCVISDCPVIQCCIQDSLQTIYIGNPTYTTDFTTSSGDMTSSASDVSHSSPISTDPKSASSAIIQQTSTSSSSSVSPSSTSGTVGSRSSSAGPSKFPTSVLLQPTSGQASASSSVNPSPTQSTTKPVGPNKDLVVPQSDAGVSVTGGYTSVGSLTTLPGAATARAGSTSATGAPPSGKAGGPGDPSGRPGAPGPIGPMDSPPVSSTTVGRPVPFGALPASSTFQQGAASFGPTTSRAASQGARGAVPPSEVVSSEQLPHVEDIPGQPGSFSKRYWTRKKDASPSAITAKQTLFGAIPSDPLGPTSTTTRKIPSSSSVATVPQPGSTLDQNPRYSIVNQSSSPSVHVIIDDGNSRKRRFSDLIPPPPPLANIFLRLGNLTKNLSTNYCANDNCRMQEGGQVAYKIPLSPNFPPVPVEIKFSLGSELVDPVSLCEKTFVYNCNSTQGDEFVLPVMNSPNIWQVPVGFFLTSTFTFRVPLQVEGANTTCQAPDADAGLTYQEYIISFIRQCPTRN